MRDRIAQWKRIFDTEENAISKSINRMTWDLATFSCVVEMVRQAPVVDDEKQVNVLFIDMLASGFWAQTMQGIRRLVENEPISGPRSVCSLGGLIADVRACRNKLTREVYVRDIAGLEYNYHRTAAEAEAYASEQRRQGSNVYWMPLESDPSFAIKRHQEFDWLSGVSAAASTPGDVIRPEVFDMLESRLGRLSSVIEHVNVEIAHAATEASREGRVLERWGLADAKQAVREIAEVACVVGNWFCYSGAGSMLPVAQFDKFAHLDSPLFTGDCAELEAVWKGFEKEVQQWNLVDPKAWMNEL